MSSSLRTPIGRRCRAASLIALLVSSILATRYAEAQCNCPPVGTCVAAGPVNGTWTPAGSPYFVTGNINVTFLTIQPGVRVEVCPNVSITVSGIINAQGTVDDAVLFTAAIQNPVQRWGGIVFSNTQPGSVFRYCTVEYANNSGLNITNASPTIEYCTIRSNTISGNGGGLSASLASGNLTIVGTTFAGNAASVHGGGINAIMTAGTLILKGCVLENNAAGSAGAYTDSVGGGLRVDGKALLQNCELRGNSCRSCGPNFTTTFPRGGGAWFAVGDSVAENCVLSGNTAEASSCGGLNGGDARGGGVHVQSGNLFLANCIIGCNTASGFTASSGGGIYLESGSINLESCTIARNNIHGIHVAGGTATAVNSIVYWNNSSGAQVAGTATITYSDVQNGFTGSGNISFDPVFAGLTGCTPCDVVIQFPSPCIDTGSPAISDACFPPSLGTTLSDMGAHGGPKACNWGLNARPPLYYCTAKTTSNGCIPAVSSSGSSSATLSSGFVVSCANLRNNKTGILFYKPCGAKIAQMYQGGTLCVGPTGIKRTPPQSSGGTGAPASDCSGMFAIDMNAFAHGAWVPPGTPDPFLQLPGAMVQCQWWGRDPGYAAPNNTMLSDAVEFTIGP